MTFEPQNELERSLIKAADDPAHRPQFYKDFVKSDIFIIQYGVRPEKQGRTVLQEGYQLKIQNIDVDGRPHIPIFSSLMRLQAVLREEAGYIALNALEFLKLTQGAELILNPGSDYGKQFTKDEIAQILDGSIWKPQERYTVPKETQVMIGQPANYPEELVSALCSLFEKLKSVKKAYLAHFFNPERDEKAHALIGIEVDGNWDEVIAQAGLVSRDIKIPDPPIDFIQISGKGGVEDYFLNDCKPFYKRKRTGFI